jgi:acyl-CoA thioester hydrolase
MRYDEAEMTLIIESNSMVSLEKVEALPFHIRFTIPEDYLDVFGHMNIQYYVKLFNDSIFAMCADYGMDTAYFQQSDFAMFGIEQHIKYLREIHVADTVATYSRFFARSDTRLHFMHFIVNETQQTLASTMEILALHVNKTERKSAAFPERLTVKLDEQIAAHNALDWNAPHSKPLGV